MNILEQLFAILEDRGNWPTVSIMLTQNQATELCNTLYKIKSQKIGKWIENGSLECSFCGCIVYPMEIENGDYNYCPNCGAKMQEEKK